MVVYRVYVGFVVFEVRRRSLGMLRCFVLGISLSVTIVVCIFLKTRLILMWAVGFCKFGVGGGVLFVESGSIYLLKLGGR